jgi:hypothetical protein
VIGRTWWDEAKIDIRLLVEPDELQVNRDTALRFSEKGKIKKLRGIHAKMYIVDDRVLLTSANLTFAGFAKRHEAGVVLSGKAARSAISLFESWWRLAIDFSNESVLNLPRRQLQIAGEDDRPGLPEPMALPPDPGDFGGETFARTFGDYPEFLRCYDQMVKVYTSTLRVWPEMPLYLETDAFLDYLFHHGLRPSRRFRGVPARPLTSKQQTSEILRHARKFQSWARGRNDDRKWRLSNTRAIRRLLSPGKIAHLSRSDIQDVASRLNCMGDGRVLSRFLQHPKNTTANVRQAWSTLLHGHKKAQPTAEMDSCALRLWGFKRSSVQELLGWYWPTRFPLRNGNVNAGLRFLGYNVRQT